MSPWELIPTSTPVHQLRDAWLHTDGGNIHVQCLNADPDAQTIIFSIDGVPWTYSWYRISVLTDQVTEPHVTSRLTSSPPFSVYSFTDGKSVRDILNMMRTADWLRVDVEVNSNEQTTTHTLVADMVDPVHTQAMLDWLLGE